MKKFCKHILFGFLFLLISMSVLDFIYTKVYEKSAPKTKFQYLRSLKNTKIDYVFLGSSRVENGIIPSIIREKTGKKAVNFGFQAAKLGDIYTLLKLIKEYNIQTENIYIQLDYIYNIVDGHSAIFQYQMMPFIRENSVVKEYSDKYTVNPVANYYLPFYRYCANDLKLGFREFFANVVNKKTNIIPNKGYGARYGTSNKLKGALPSVIIEKNLIMDSIQSFIKQNSMNVIFYCAPFCKSNQNKSYISQLGTKIPGLVDFSKVINEDEMFVNCNHLNDSGAKRFTAILTEELLTTKTK